MQRSLFITLLSNLIIFASLQASGMITVTDEKHFNDLLKNNMPTVLDFSTSWCGACQSMKPTLEKMSTEYKDRIQFLYIDGDKFGSLRKKYDVHAYPRFIFLDSNNKQVDELRGAGATLFEQKVARLAQATKSAKTKPIASEKKQAVPAKKKEHTTKPSKKMLSEIATANDFTREIINSNIPVLIHFYSEECKNCPQVKSILDDLTSEFKDRVKIVRINVNNKNLRGIMPDRTGILVIPSYKFSAKEMESGHLNEKDAEKRIRTLINSVL